MGDNKKEYEGNVGDELGNDECVRGISCNRDLSVLGILTESSKYDIEAEIDVSNSDDII